LLALQQKVRQLYKDFSRDPFMVPSTRRRLFDKSEDYMQAIHASTLHSWLSSVQEAIETRRHREKLHAELKENTIFKYFPSKKDHSTKGNIRSNIRTGKPPSPTDELTDLLRPIFEPAKRKGARSKHKTIQTNTGNQGTSRLYLPQKHE
jgi:hypothetical protein